MGRLFRLAVVLAALVLGNGVAVAAPATPGIAPPATIAWQPCPTTTLPTKECGTLTVPLDYDSPAGASIAIAVARMPATDHANRLGSLVLNPGGPGGPGVDALPLMYAALPAPLPARFDVVGFDPRGIGQSSPVQCFPSIAAQTAFFAAIPSVPMSDAEVAARQRAAAELAQLCGERDAEILPHLSTANVARDMDRLRQALGAGQLT